jgi:ATP-binding cassette subfamily F protein uup
MNILSLENITKTFREKPLIDSASFYLNEGEKVGIIGINGTGKSTLLKIIAGIQEIDGGKITKANNIVIKYLSQTPEFEENETVLESIVRQNLSKVNTKWEIESEAKTILNKLGMDDYNANVSKLSGGQKKKVALVSVLVSKADILLLDEPTNHLDNQMSDWLEEYLQKFKGALIMVTHDRYFFDSVTNRIVEIDKGKIYSYQANYSGFLELKAEREDMQQASERKRQSILRNELAWIRRGARARSTKQKARIDRYEELKAKSSPISDDTINMSSVSTRLGKTTIELCNISKSYDEKILFKDFEYIFLKGDRIGFIGKNGCGKTTLMKMIAGRLEPDSGKVVKGQTVKIGYYTQEIKKSVNDEINLNKDDITYMNSNQRVIDYIRDTAEYVMTTEGSISASVMLDRFLFPPEKQYTKIEHLSGGEKRRLNLLRVLMEAPNVLILDEPTNDLDITTLTILEDYLDSFDGIVITVSHDRYFLDRVARRIFAFEGEGIIRQYEGGYSDYILRKSVEQELNDNNNINISEKNNQSAREEYKAQKNNNKKLKFSYKEQKEYESIEDEISKLESEISTLESEMSKYASDFMKLNEINMTIDNKKQELEHKIERWTYLEELAEQISRQ